MSIEYYSKVIEAALFTSMVPLNIDALKAYFPDEAMSARSIREAIAALEGRYADSAMVLQEVASGWRFIVKDEYTAAVSAAREEKPAKYSRALLETLALIAFKQPITRGEIESVRGVAVSSNILRTLTERQWVRSVGHKEVPGRPLLYATTPAFLDYFNLRSLADLPELAELRDLDAIGSELFAANNSGDKDYTSGNTDGASSSGQQQEEVVA